MSAIGGYSLDSLHGTFDALGSMVEEISRPGVDGYAFRLTGKRATPRTFQSLSFTTNAAGIANIRTNFAALQGTVVSVTDAEGNVFNNIMVLKVEIQPPQPCGIVVGALTASSRFMVPAIWTLQATDVP